MANPPITIGELVDVPAPGSPIASAWTQEATQRVVHRFANSATRDAQYTNRVTGALAYTIDAGRLCMWDSAGWIILREPPTTVPAGSGFQTKWPHSAGASSTPVGVAATWAAPTTVQAMYMRAAGQCFIEVQFTLGASGFSIGQFNIPFPAAAPQPFDNQFAVSLLQGGVDFWSGWVAATGGQAMSVMAVGVSGAGTKRLPITGTVPFTWKAGDQVTIAGVFTLSNPYDAYYMNP